MADRDGWRDRVKRIRAISTTWWWWRFHDVRIYIGGSVPQKIDFISQANNFGNSCWNKLMENFIFQQDGAPPHWKRTVCAYLDENLPERWIGCGGDEDSFLMKCRCRHRTCSRAISFYGDMWRDWSIPRPLSASIDEMKQRITSALDNVIGDLLQRVWQEVNYRLDVCRVTGGAHIEHLWNQSQNKHMMFYTWTVQFHWTRLSSFQDNYF